MVSTDAWDGGRKETPAGSSLNCASFLGIRAISWARVAFDGDRAFSASSHHLSVIKTNFRLLNFVVVIKRQTIPLVSSCVVVPPVPDSGRKSTRRASCNECQMTERGTTAFY